MKVILSRDVEGLGRAGDVVNAAEGHARNFLLPRKLAVAATPAGLKAIEKKKKMLELKGEQLAEEAKAIAERLADVTVTIKEKAGSGTKLYGSVTNQEIADALLEQHAIRIDKRKIHTDQPIKNVGTFDVPVKLHQDVSASVKVEVLAKEE